MFIILLSWLVLTLRISFLFFSVARVVVFSLFFKAGLGSSHFLKVFVISLLWRSTYFFLLEPFAVHLLNELIHHFLGVQSSFLLVSNTLIPAAGIFAAGYISEGCLTTI